MVGRVLNGDKHCNASTGNIAKLRNKSALIFGACIFVISSASAYLLAQVSTEQHPIVVNDVSRLNPTPVLQVYEVHDAEQIRAVLNRAAKEHLKVSIAGKRHSQGGQTAYPGGLVLDMTGFNKILGLDQPKKVITVQSGATWKQVQNYINPYGLAVKVQQASNIFTIGGSLSVNAHGRDPTYGPIIQTVQGFHLMKADGTIVHVSRTENSDLFPLVIGGYGLFGVILDVDLELADNAIYEKRHESVSYTDYLDYFSKKVKGNRGVGLEYAWPSIRKKNFLRHFAVYTFVKTEKHPANIFKLQEENDIALNGAAFGLSRHSETGKDVRWFLQESIADMVSTHIVSRNNAMRPPIQFLSYNSPHDTDILQEYFVPVDRLVVFIDSLREILLRRKVDLLSITVRYVAKDSECFLAYAREDSFAFVLYINQSLSSEGKNEAEKWTREIVEAALRNRGTYYLPYQLYPSEQQIQAAYPMLGMFFAKKKAYDPAEMFDSTFYERYRSSGK